MPYAHHLLDGNEDKGEPRSANALKLSKKKYHATFVLSQYPNGAEDVQNYRERQNIEPIHAGTVAHITKVVEPFPNHLWGAGACHSDQLS